MKIEHAVVFVSDLEKAKAFYQGKLGLKVKQERPDIRSIMFETEGATLGVHVPSEENRGKAQIGRSTGILFWVPKVEEAWRELSAKGVVFTKTPQGADPQRPDRAHFVDQDGNEFGLVEERI